ncbi:MAG TPA: class I SAM-dependent methyltransferase [Saprospiraceae bacterium]|nr:class I SAM-dependent methyltransferase [Saprospiraceae bacterium]
MRLPLSLLTFSLCLIALSGCRQDAPTAAAPDAPSLFREKNPPGKTVSDPLPLPATGAGNFENLVADYESKDRGIWQKPEMVISLLGDLQGKTVADIGAGTGYFTFRLVPRAEKVIGIDIDQRFIRFLDSVKVRLPLAYRHRFEARLARPEDPLLRPEEADAVMIVNTYGYMQQRVQYLQTLIKGMKPGGQLLIIDFKKNNLPVGPPDQYKVALSQVERELMASGYAVRTIDKDALDYQYIIIAEKPKDSPTRPTPQ